MAYYLIDYENVKNLNRCNELTAGDTIIFFYSQHANLLSFDLHIALCQTPARTEYFFVECGGKNALDFQMSSYVGFLIANYPYEKIYIVSKDKGFSFLLSFWRKRGFDQLELTENICTEHPAPIRTANGKSIASENDPSAPDMDQAPNAEEIPDAPDVPDKQDAPAKEKPARRKKETEHELPSPLSEALKTSAAALNLSDAQQAEIEKIVKNYKTKQAINNNLMKLFRDSDKVGKINKLIKPFLKEKK